MLSDEFHDTQSRTVQPIRSQSSWRSNYYPNERTGHRARRRSQNAFVAARMGYRAFD